MSKLSWESTGNLQRKSSFINGNINFKEVFLRITPDRTPGSETTNVVRLISQPNAYYVHWANKKDPDADNKLVKVSFPDSELSNRPTRICSSQITENGLKEDPNCPWCKLGYSRQLRFMVNVISRDNNKVMILDAPTNVINDIHAWVEGAQDEELENTDPSSWNKPAPDFRIKAVRKNGGSIEWTTSATNKHKKLTEEDLDLIRAINPDAVTDEEALKLYPLEVFTKPTPILTEANARPSSNDEEEEEERPRRQVQRDTSESTKVSDPYSDSDDINDDDEEDIKPIKIRAGEDEDDDDDDW